MEFDSKLPGDDQTPEMVGEWVRDNVRTGTIMIARYEYGGNFAFEFVEVDFLNTTEPYLYTQAHGTFDMTGQRASVRLPQARLLIPLPKVVDYAENNLLWVKGHRVRAHRPTLDRHEELRRKLFEQMKLITPAPQH